jgi:hypothetical protein
LSSKAVISTEGTDVIISNASGHDIAIYSIDGLVIAPNNKVSEDTKRYPLYKGVFFITIDSTVTKLIIK